MAIEVMFSPEPSGTSRLRVLSRCVASTMLSLGPLTAVSGQFAPYETTESNPEPTTLLETRVLPVAAPWQSPGTPTLPDWLENGDNPTTSLISPGLGTTIFGDSPLRPVTTVARRSGRGPSDPTLVPLGPLDVGFDLNYSMNYGTGLDARGNGSDTDGSSTSFRHAVTPGINLHAGDRWSVRYAPTANFYSAEGYQDTFDQTVRLAGSASAPAWDFNLDHTTAISSTPLVETGRQTDQTIHSSGVNAAWDLNGHDSLSFSLTQVLRFADDSPDSVSWSNQNWYDRPLSDHITAGLGVGFGYNKMDPGTDMTSERLNARFQGRIGSKFTYSVSGGCELRQFLDTDASSKLSPLVAASVTYQVLKKTSFFASFDHTISTSYFTDQITENSSFQGGITQVISPKWTASASGGYRSSDYQSATDTSTSVRKDNTPFSNFTLSWRVLRRLTAAVSYSFRANSSDRVEFDFDSHQFGLRLNYSI